MKDEIERLTNIWEIIMDGLKNTDSNQKITIYKKQLEEVEKLVFMAYLNEVKK